VPAELRHVWRIEVDPAIRDQGRFNRAVSGGYDAIGRVEGKARSAFASIGNVAKAAAGLAGIGSIGLALAKAARDATAFDAQFTNVVTLFGDAKSAAAQFGEPLESVRDRLKDMSGALGSATDLTRSLYQTISSGIPAAKAFDVVTAGAELAAAGMADAELSTSLLTTVLNAFPGVAGGAAGAADLLFNTVKLGKVEVADLAQGFGNILPAAQLVGVRLEEAAAGVAALSLTQPAAIAMTNLQNAFTSIAKEADDFKKAGIDIIQILREDGLAGALKVLRERFGDDPLSLRNIIKDQQAIAGIVPLITTQYRAFTDALESNKSAAGAAHQAYLLQAQSLSGLWKELKERVNVAFVDFGEVLLREVAPGIQSLTESLRTGIESGQVRDFAQALVDAARAAGESFGQISAVVDDFTQTIRMVGDDASITFGEVVVGAIQSAGATFNWLSVRAQQAFNLILAAATATGSAIYQAITFWFQKAVDVVATLTGGLLERTGRVFDQFGERFGVDLLTDLGAGLQQAAQQAEQSIRGVAEAIRGPGQDLADIAEAANEKIVLLEGRLVNLADAAGPAGIAIKAAAVQIEVSASAAGETGERLKVLGDELKRLREQGKAGTPQYKAVADAIEEIGRESRRSAPGVGALGKEIAQIRDELLKAAGFISTADLNTKLAGFSSAFATLKAQGGATGPVILKLSNNLVEFIKDAKAGGIAVDRFLTPSLRRLLAVGRELTEQEQIGSWLDQKAGEAQARVDLQNEQMHAIGKEMDEADERDRERARRARNERIQLFEDEMHRRAQLLDAGIDYAGSRIRELGDAITSGQGIGSAIGGAFEGLLGGAQAAQAARGPGASFLDGLKDVAKSEEFQKAGLEMLAQVGAGLQAAQGALKQTLGGVMVGASTFIQNYKETGDWKQAGFAAIGAVGEGIAKGAYGVKAAIGGAMSGAAKGFVVAGPVGAVAGAIIGGIAGAFNKKPAWLKVSEEVQRNLGVSLSEGAAKAIIELKQVVGPQTRAVRETLGLDIILQEATVGADNIDKFSNEFLKLGRMAQQGGRLGEEALKHFGASFGLLVGKMREAGLSGSKAFGDIVAAAKVNGARLPEVTEFLKGAVTEAAAGLNILFQNAGRGGAEAFERLGTISADVFAAMKTLPGGAREAIEALGPGLDRIVAKSKELGLALPEGIAGILGERAFLEKNADLFATVEGLTRVTKGLGEAGFFTAQGFQAVNKSAVDTFNQLVSAGRSQEMALTDLQPVLQEIVNEHVRNGKAIDAGTQSLIQQASEMGIISLKGTDLASTFERVGDRIIGAIGAALGKSGAVSKFMSESANEAAMAGQKIGSSFSTAAGVATQSFRAAKNLISDAAAAAEGSVVRIQGAFERARFWGEDIRQRLAEREAAGVAAAAAPALPPAGTPVPAPGVGAGHWETLPAGSRNERGGVRRQPERRWVPGFATGIDFVPYDMHAVIHKGERVVPAKQNRAGSFGGEPMQLIVQIVAETGEVLREIVVDTVNRESRRRRITIPKLAVVAR